jgi:hypothetical protein
MQIDVEIPEDIDNSGMKGKPKPDKQQIPKDDNLILLRPQHNLFSESPQCPNHPVLLQGCHIPLIYQAPSEGVRLWYFLRDGVTPPLQSHDYKLL